MGREVEGRFKREGTYVYLWLIHVGVWQRPTQYCNYPLIKNKRRVFFFLSFKDNFVLLSCFWKSVPDKSLHLQGDSWKRLTNAGF